MQNYLIYAKIVYRKIDIFNQFIQILKIIISIFILKITTHSNSKMVGRILSRLK